MVSSSIGDTHLALGDRNLIKKWLSTLLAGASLSTSASPQQTYAVGNISIMLPAGWQLVESSEDKLVFRTKDNHQHATITVMHFGVSANFEDFKLLCEARFKAERMAITDGYIEPDTPAPVKDGDTFWMFYSGGERKSHRLFTGYLSLKQKELLTIYIEGIGVPMSDLVQSFKAFLDGAKRR